ncbi:whirlin isoform X7 [Neodiprion pinetum]|uniref:Whirlin isoform X7 n=1 Tax=Neodiprion lecontei TaxID=441921 RepID=A0ABM3G8W7_NEOLC|nr:whirlin isoform X7 [Neodiprion pinetum]XP_046596717.1 whirlin isoform X7 [Neodiprion lecontei]
MASSTEDYGSELQELQWGGGSGSNFLRSGSHFLRTGCYEAEDLESTRHQTGQNRGYYSPPGTSYTIVERPPSAPHHHSTHTTPYRKRGHGGGGSGAISPEQVLRLFGNGVNEKRQTDRRTPASSPASVAALRNSASQSGQQNLQTSPPPQPPSLQELTVRTITMARDPPDSHHGFGICVKGGKDAEVQSGVGVYISRVEEGSVAERAGLRPGDTILEVNGIPFRAVTHEEALKMLKSCRTLSMTVRGPALDPRCRGSHPGWTASGRQQSCSWMDRQGRPASPPPLHSRDGRYAAHRTRKVELCIEPGQSLGLMIRGGLEYGLGIYVTGVDKDSVADRAGLLIGDQIIEVNGQSFEEATHDEAVQILKTNKRMSLVIRDVGKVPHSCTTSQPVVVPPSRYQEHDPLLLDSPASHGNHRPPSPGTGSTEWRNRALHSATAAMVEEKARVVLARSERAALSQLLGDYRSRRLTIEDLVASLGDLLNTHEKLTLLTELRELVDGKDRAAFDDLVYRPRTNVTLARRKGDRTHSDLVVTPSIHDLPDYEDEAENDRGRRHSSPGGSRGNTRDFGHHHLHADNLESDGGCEGSDSEMMGNGRRGERDREEDDEDEEGREERNSESGGGGFGGWRNHLLGGLTQRVKSWYWGARPLLTPLQELAHKLSRSFDMQEAQLLEEVGSGSGTNGSGGSGRPPRRHHSAQRLARGDMATGREDDGALVVPDHQGNLRITVRKTKSILGIAIEGGANTKHPLPRIINIHDNGAAFEAGGLEVGQLILEVDGHKVQGLHHQEVARLIADSFARRDRNEIEFLVVEAKKSNLEPKPTALIFLEA